jgi:hypothetical protein
MHHTGGQHDNDNHSRFPAARHSQYKIADNFGDPGAGQPAAENKYSPNRNYRRVAEAG